MVYPLKIDRKRLAQIMAEKGGDSKCFSCGHNNWAFLDEAAVVPQLTNTLPAPGIPAAIMVCINCGYIRMHALGPLNMIPKDGGDDE